MEGQALKNALISLLALSFLAACGAAGEPITPSANLGLNIGPNGVSTSASVGAQSGPVSINIGL